VVPWREAERPRGLPDPPSMTYQLDLQSQGKKEGRNIMSTRVKRDGWLSVDMTMVVC